MIQAFFVACRTWHVANYLLLILIVSVLQIYLSQYKIWLSLEKCSTFAFDFKPQMHTFKTAKNIPTYETNLYITAPYCGARRL